MFFALALDIGTTATKAVLVDRSGRVVAVHAEEYALDKPGPDRVELDPEVYWTSAAKATRAVLSTSSVDAADVAAIGVTSQGETLIVLDDADRPLRPAIVWLDNRSAAEARELGDAFDLDTIYRVTGQQELVPTWTATRIAWLRRHEPAVFRRADTFLLVADYLVHRLTGSFVSDRGLNPSTLYFDLARGDWWDDMLGQLGIERRQLPALRGLGEGAGMLTAAAASATGLRPGTPVFTAPIDQVAGAVGAGNLAPGGVSETTGAALALCATTERPVYDPQKRVGLYRHAVPGRFVLLPWEPTAGMVLRWFRDELGGGRSYDALLAEAAQVAPGADGLLLLPHLAGAVCPEANPRARGVFRGLTLGHRRAHFTRAIIEAVAFMLRENLEMLEALGVPVGEVRSLGGAARSELWLHVKADVCGRELTVMDVEEAAGLGAAMIAFVGCGAFATLAEARDAMVRVRRRIAPAPDAVARYEAVYRRYRDLWRDARPLF